jgi:hypothetical protein
MTETDNIPSLEGLDPSQPDYAVKLDEGIKRIFDLTDANFQKLRQAQIEANDGLLKLLEEHGLKTQRGPEIVVISPRGGLAASTYFGDASSLEEKRKIEDLVATYKREKEADLKPLEDRQRDIQRAAQDFGQAILDNTRIEPLSQGLIYTLLHIYLITPNGVFEAQDTLSCHPNKKSFPTNLTENPNLKPEHFKEESFITRFKEQSQDVGALGYLIFNPSAELPVQELFNYASKQIKKEICDKCPVKKQEDSMKKFGGSLN